ncbi:MAG: fibronectin type III domain-containing protein, partial [Euryarchaeota archaeon]|nr:fibronectin type III domain-containing protein [Euryarchaeota archaeon]
DQPDALDKWNLLSKTSDEKNLPPKAVNLVPPRQVGPTRVNVSWSGPVEPDVVRFEIHRGAKPGFPLTAASKAGEVKNNKATSAEVDTLTPNTTYYFHVRIVDKGGLTADSNEASLRLEPHFGGPTTVVAGARNDDGGSAPFPSVALTLLGLLLVARMSRAWPRLDGRRDPPWRSRR